MQSAVFLQDLAVVLLAAGLMAVIFDRLGQPRVVGYILAGVLIGPHTPPFSFVREDQSIRTLADLGVIFLMFSVGLQFNFRRLRKVGITAGVTALLDVLVMLWLGFLLGRHWGWNTVESLFLGAVICNSSTTILIKLLSELGRLRERHAGLTAAVTVVEDVLSVVLMAVLTGLATSGRVETGVVGVRVGHLVVFLVTVGVAGTLILPRLLDRVARSDGDELLLLAVLGVCFGVSLVAAKLQLSVALGAVLVGAIASESRASEQLERIVRSLRHVFGAVFFVAVGLLFDPATAWRHLPAVIAVTLLVVAGKFVNCTVGGLLTGQDLSTALRVGSGMAQIGEFAFIMAALGLTLGAIEPSTYQIAVATSVITTLISPNLMRGVDRCMPSVMRWARRTHWHATLDLYGQWVRTIGKRRADNAIRRTVRRAVIIVTVNLILIGAFFALAGYVASRHLAPLPGALDRPEWYRTALWLAAVVVSLPLYTATVRKIRAMAMLLAELSVPADLGGTWTRQVRAVLSRTVTGFGIAGLILLTLMLSSTLLPSLRTLVPLALLVVILAVWSRRVQIRLYSRAQAALEAALGDRPGGEAEEPHEEEDARHFAGRLGDARLHSVVLSARSPAVGRGLRELDLRRRSGASVVAVEREGHGLVTPDPEWVFQPQDRLYLIGHASQLAAARHELNEPG